MVPVSQNLDAAGTGLCTAIPPFGQKGLQELDFYSLAPARRGEEVWLAGRGFDFDSNGTTLLPGPIRNHRDPVSHSLPGTQASSALLGGADFCRAIESRKLIKRYFIAHYGSIFITKDDVSASEA